MRTVYLGTSEFAVGVLRRLAASPHRPSLVVTRPDRPRGRGRRLASPPVAAAARELGIAVEQPESVNDVEALERIAAAEPEAVCVCAFGALIREPLLSAYELLNVHPSLLPRWRGAAPIERAIIAGDETTGVSIMRLDAGLDSGPLGAQASEAISSTDTYGTLAHRLTAMGGRLLISVLEERPGFVAQDDRQATYAEKITAPDRVLDGSRPAVEHERVVRALNPHIGAAVLLADGTRLGVWEARVVAGDGEAGRISLGGPAPVLACAEGSLELTVVQPPGGRPMPGEAYLRGRR